MLKRPTARIIGKYRLSIAAINADAMRTQGVYNIEQLQDFVPNLSLNQGDRANQAAIFIRGIGGVDPGQLRQFGSGLYIDGHYLPQLLDPFMSTVDIERVEVLRGPQGTPFVKNSTGGAISIIGAEPGPELEGSLTARAGEYGQQDLRGMVNLPVNDQVATRFSVASDDELNLTLQPALAPLVAYQPGKVSNYEVGFKATLAGGRVRMASALFFMDYTDKQEAVTIDNSDGSFGPDPSVSVITNAGKVDIYGVELELRVTPWDGGFLTFDLGFLQNEYGRFASFDPDAPDGVVDLSRTQIQDFSPEVTIDASIEHAFQLRNGASLTPQLGMYYQSEYEWLQGLTMDSPESYCHQDAFSRFRTRLTYAPANANWEASLFGNNIGDERYLNGCANSRSGAYRYFWGKPADWGLEFNARWGNN